MKHLALIALFSACAQAQTVDVKDVKSEDEGTTTIEIRKGSKNNPAKSDSLWEVQDGDAEIAGDPQAMEREARKAWKDACSEWKKEFRSDNKDNKIISMNCGTPNCTGEVGKKTCTSKATYKVKTKMN